MLKSKNESAQVGWGWWLRWTLIQVGLSVALIFISQQVMVMTTTATRPNNLLLSLVSAGALLIPLAVQGLLLPVPLRASALAWVLFIFGAFFVGRLLFIPMSMWALRTLSAMEYARFVTPTERIFYSLMTALGQWWVLRRYVLRAHRWIWGSVASRALGVLLWWVLAAGMLNVSSLYVLPTTVLIALVNGLGDALYFGLTGALLWHLLEHTPAPAEKPKPAP